MTRELRRVRRRLSGVSRSSTLAFCLILVALLPSPALAQSGIELEVSAGIGGYAAVGVPLTIDVTIRPEILFVGEIEVNSSGVLIRVPAEIPAGTSKTFSIATPPYGGQVTRVRLYPDGSDRPVANQTVQLRVPKDVLLAGVFEVGSDVAGELDATKTTIADVSVVSVRLQTLDGPFEPLAYVISGDLARAPDQLWSWVKSGGRIVTDDDVVPPDGSVAVASAPGSSLYMFGDGELLVVPDLDAVGADWSRLLRPVEITTTNLDPWATPERALAQVASSAGGSQAQSLPWLLAALLGYVVLVGPVNFLVLRKVKRRELAWATIPAISLVTLGGFWLAGRQRLASTELTQASLVIAGEVVEQRSVVVLAAGSAGVHTVGFDAAASVYPANLQNVGFGQAGPSATGTVSGNEVSFDLPQLGFGAVHAQTQGPAVPKISMSGEKVTVENTSQYNFWAWGVAGSNRLASVHGDPLAPGQTAGIEVPDNQGFFFGMNLADQVIERLQLWNDQRTWQIFYPLGEAAGYLAGNIDLYFFGYVEDYPISAKVDGIDRVVTGPALVIVPIAAAKAETGQSSGVLLSVGKNGFVEGGGPGYVFVNSNEMYVSLRVPTDLAADPLLGFRNDFGQAPRQIQAWDWESGVLVEVAIGDQLDRSRFVSPTGEVVIRAGEEEVEGEDDLGGFDQPMIGMTPNSVTLNWDRA